MSETAQMWMEIIFNVLYLVVIWTFVVMMIRRLTSSPEPDRLLIRMFIWAFALLAIGDTGHVGFRVLAYALGGLETTVTIFGAQIGLVGIGAFATSTTVTLFYLLLLVIWRTRFNKPYGWFGYLLFAVAIARLVLMLPAANEWNNTVPPVPWGLYRNLPLMVQGLGVAYLILRDAFATQDRTFKWIGVMILVSYAFYVPVILFVRQVPAIGMLMIPKTLAYVAIAFLGYRLTASEADSEERAPSPQYSPNR